ncbi:hypothetical protein BC834DRAFT_1033030 [Gloeopeniophorella convolvens]|nr:hypothetical protein BC834DRAFT_1033030 [Gloeopeniophorella convolvens]
MNTLWVPVPVALFFRRVVNVLSTVSITHHYLLPREPAHPEPAPVPLPAGRASALRRLDELWRSADAAAGAGIPPLRARMETRLDSILNGTLATLLPLDTLAALAPRLSLFRLHTRPPPSCSRTTRAGGRLPPPPSRRREPEPERERERGAIHALMANPVLYDPLRAPRFPIVLCHGLYGFDVRGPAAFPRLRMHYWSRILGILRRTVGAEVLVTSVPGTGSVAARAEALDPPLSLTTIGTPHRGSPFMDWCKEYLGLGRAQPEGEGRVAAVAAAETAHAVAAAAEATSAAKAKATPADKDRPGLSLAALPSSFTALLLGMFDSPAYANLTTSYLNDVFNPATPDDPRVRYFSIAGRSGALGVWHPLWLPKLVLDGADGGAGNDGLVSVASARWGEFLGAIEGTDHWALRGASGIELGAGGDAWGLGDWGRFVRALGRAEGRAEGGAAGPGADDALRSATDRLSAVVDWIVEQVPGGARAFGGGGGEQQAQVQRRRSDLATKEDLERLYVALSRKLYDEGL